MYVQVVFDIYKYVYMILVHLLVCLRECSVNSVAVEKGVYMWQIFGCRLKKFCA